MFGGGGTMELDLFFGPGGVGKTTLSACHALRASEAGERVLIISVDPARRLAQCLGKEPIGLEPVEVPGAPGLFAALSLPVEGMDLLIRRGARSGERLRRLREHRLFQLGQELMPGADELSAVALLGRVIDESERWDRVVLDTPPAQNARQFLRMPDRLSRIANPKLRRLVMGRGATQTIVWRLCSRMFGDGLTDELRAMINSLEGSLDAIGETAGRVRDGLRSTSARAFVVSSAETAPLRRAATLESQLRSAGLTTTAFVANRVENFPRDAGKNPPEAVAEYAQLCRERAEQHQREVEAILAPVGLPILGYPRLALPPIGVDALRELSGRMDVLLSSSSH